MPESPTILLDSFADGKFAKSFRFSGYVETVQAIALADVPATIRRVEHAAKNDLYAVGFIAYEAAAALNKDLQSLPPTDGLPLAWFALFRERHAADCEENSPSMATVPPRLDSAICKESYLQNVEKIKEYIACGDSYQVNYTFPMAGSFSGDPMELYKKVAAAQKAPFNAFIDTGRHTIISASPELFFSLKDGIITTRPMKGTARRGRWLEEDQQLIEGLKASEKERAENLMIVDLLRNDLGIIAETGSVRVGSLFDVETYPTVHQMTSTVSARINGEISLSGILGALFPCGSVTGAPKRRSMEIISELESSPRGVYCGAVGYVAPGGEALFSVAIRTLLLDRGEESISLGIGSGITIDSDPKQEHRECLTKSGFLHSAPEEFQLIESLRLENGGYYLLERHLLRLRSSASYFGFGYDETLLRKELQQHAQANSGIRKVRLLLQRHGAVTIESEPLILSDQMLRIAVSCRKVDSKDTFLYHKTTRREPLDQARKERTDVDEVILVNERGELTEGSYHNLIVAIDGRMLTPKRGCGLLAGVMRQEMLEHGEISEATLYPEDLIRAESIWLINSVRGKRGALYPG